MDIKDYYSRKEIKEQLLFSAKDREFSARYKDGGFGKRPGVIHFENDIQELVNEGAVSFHISEELWHNPLELEAGMSQAKLDNLRKGWDLILDIDCPCFEYSRLTAYLLVEAIKFHDVSSVYVKFSGNKGMHIGVPFKAFPKEIDNQKIEYLFPDAPRIVASYLGEVIKEALSAGILEKDSVEEIEKKIGKKRDEFIIEGKFEPFKIIDIDTVLISNRHMFRAPYSVHEKTGLISVPILGDKILAFEKEDANPEKITFNLKFLDDSNVEEGEAKQLFMQAYDWYKKKNLNKPIKQELHYEEVKGLIPEEYFPPCIKLLLQGIKEDGRKRALFILINFLSKTGYTYEDVEAKIYEWNKKNSQPLREGYIKAQLQWFKRNGGLIPPGCSNEAYYISLLVCKPDGFCPKIKNPAHYAIRKQKLLNLNNSDKKRASKRKSL